MSDVVKTTRPEDRFLHDVVHIRSGSTVTCMLFIFLFIIDILFIYFLSDLDIDS